MDYATLICSETMVVPRSLKVSTCLRLHGHLRLSLEAIYSGGLATTQSRHSILIYLTIEYEKSEYNPATDAHTRGAHVVTTP